MWKYVYTQICILSENHNHNQSHSHNQPKHRQNQIETGTNQNQDNSRGVCLTLGGLLWNTVSGRLVQIFMMSLRKHIYHAMKINSCGQLYSKYIMISTPKTEGENLIPHPPSNLNPLRIIFTLLWKQSDFKLCYCMFGMETRLLNSQAKCWKILHWVIDVN